MSASIEDQWKFSIIKQNITNINHLKNINLSLRSPKNLTDASDKVLLFLIITIITFTDHLPMHIALRTFSTFFLLLIHFFISKSLKHLSITLSGNVEINPGPK